MHVQGVPAGYCPTFEKDLNGNLRTYVQTYRVRSFMITETITPEECGFLAVPPTVPV